LLCHADGAARRFYRYLPDAFFNAPCAARAFTLPFAKEKRRVPWRYRLITEKYSLAPCSLTPYLPTCTIAIACGSSLVFGCGTLTCWNSSQVGLFWFGMALHAAAATLSCHFCLGLFYGSLVWFACGV
jgi:hypothetical protein